MCPNVVKKNAQNMKKLLFTSLLLLIVGTIFSQKKKANQLYDHLGYKASIPLFEERGDLSTEDLIKIANSYRLNHDVVSAELWYSQVVQESTEPIHILHYAQALHSNKKYEQAREYYQLYNERIGGSDQRGQYLSQAIENIKSFKRTNSTIQNEARINSGSLDFSPAFYQEGIVFVSSRHPKGKNKKKPSENSSHIDPWMNDNYMTLFYAEKGEDNSLEKPSVFSTNISTKYHEGPVCFSRSGDKLFFSRNHYNNGKRKNDKKGIMKMNIYSAIRTGEDWRNVKELAFNTEEYDEAHPALSADGNRLFFASNRAGGFGGMDIYYASFSGGQWSEPVNLGKDINTPGNEIFPFIHDDGTLYFASDGWGGLGGLDIFSSIETNENAWENPINLGTPFNSSKDDFGFILNTTATEGYLSSAREGGYGKDDIYSFRILDKEQLGRQLKATICVYDAVTNERIENAQVSISQEQINKNQEIEEDFTMRLVETEIDNEYILKLTKEGGMPNNKEVIKRWTEEDGAFSMDVIPNEHYYLVAQKDGYEVAEQPFFTTLEGTNQLEFCIPLKKSACLTLKGRAFNKKYESLMSNVSVSIKNLCDGEILELKTDASGKYEWHCLPCHCEFEIIGTKAGFQTANNTASTLNAGCAKGGIINANLMMIPGEDAPVAEPITVVNSPLPEVGQVIELKKIYYDFDRYYIRSGAQESLEEVVAMMKQYPSMVIELSSHTDARGATNYNRWLSRLRAKAAVDYLQDKGIQPFRLKARGYGETRLRNNCADGVDCSELEHQYNRRTEVKILEFDRRDISVNEIDNEPETVDAAPWREE